MSSCRRSRFGEHGPRTGGRSPSCSRRSPRSATGLRRSRPSTSTRARSSSPLQPTTHLLRSPAVTSSRRCTSTQIGSDSASSGWQSHGRGVGSALLAAAIEKAREDGLHKLALEVFPHNEAAIALYRKFGFVEE